MAKGLPTFSEVTCAELLAAAQVEAEVHDRLAGPLVEAGLGVGQILALHHDALLDRQGAGLVCLVVGQGLDVGRVGAGVGDEPEFELGRRAEDVLQPLGILQARHFHEDAVVADPLDVGLARAEASTRRRSTSID